MLLLAAVRDAALVLDAEKAAPLLRLVSGVLLRPKTAYPMRGLEPSARCSSAGRSRRSTRLLWLTWTSKEAQLQCLPTRSSNLPKTKPQRR